MHKIIFLLAFILFCLNLHGQELKPKEKKGLYGFSNGKEIVIDYQYDTVDYYFDDRYFVRKNGLWGVVSIDSTEMIPCQYESIDPWLRKKYLVSNDGLFGIIDSTGTLVWDLIYDEIDHTKGDTVALVRYKGAWALYQNGKLNYDEEEFYFMSPDTMPLFSGCDTNLPYKELKSCSENLMYKYIFENIRYPALARENGIQGQVILQFVVDKRGDIRNPTIVRGLGGGLNEEALRVVQNMPRWHPAILDGKNVKMLFTLPIRYKLQ